MEPDTNGLALKPLVPLRVEQLELDSQNPRLPSSVDASDQMALIAYFDERYELDEIADSMLAKGYFPQEPLLVIESDTDGKYVTIEGNRRLATLKLLTDPTAPEATKRAAFWRERQTSATSDLLAIPCFVYDARADLEDYLGFRHVTGIVQWSAEAKARFVSRLVAEGRGFTEAARAIGSRSDAVRRQFMTWSALEQANRAGVPMERATRFFGTFYRALQTQGIREYVGLPDPRLITPDDTTPIPEGQEDRLGVLSDWLFGNGEAVKPLFTDSRRLTDLGRVLAKPDARQILEQEGDFRLALEVAGNDRESIESALYRARSELVKANSVAYDFAGDPEIIALAHAVEKALRSVISSLSVE